MTRKLTRTTFPPLLSAMRQPTALELPTTSTRTRRYQKITPSDPIFPLHHRHIFFLGGRRRHVVISHPPAPPCFFSFFEKRSRERRARPRQEFRRGQRRAARGSRSSQAASCRFQYSGNLVRHGRVFSLFGPRRCVSVSGGRGAIYGDDDWSTGRERGDPSGAG
jgi:hypothetical protein